MKQVGLFEAKTKLSALCEEVADRDESIVITRRGKPWVKIAPYKNEEAGQTVWQAREKVVDWLEDFELPKRELEKPFDIDE